MDKKYPVEPILIIDDEKNYLDSIEILLHSEGISNIIFCSDSRTASEIIDKHRFSLLVVDLYMPFVSGEYIIKEFKAKHPEVPIIIVSARQDIKFAVQSMKNDVIDYLVKPVEPKHLLQSIHQGLEIYHIKDSAEFVKSFLLQKESFADFMHGESGSHFFNYLIGNIQKEYSNLFDKIPVPLILIDSQNLRIVHCNKALIDFLHIPSTHELIGEKLTELLSTDSLILKKYFQDLQTKRIIENVSFFIENDTGIPRYILGTLRLLEEGGFCYISLTDDSQSKTNKGTLIKRSNEIDNLLGEIDHRVYNNLQILLSLLHLQETTIKDTPTMTMIKKIQDRIMSMYLGYSLIDFSSYPFVVDVEQYLETVIDYLIRKNESPENNINVDIDVGFHSLRSENIVHFGLIINELISNSIQHAFPDSFSGQPELAVQCKKTGSGRVEFIFSDNGTGLPRNDDDIVTSSLGLLLVKSLVEDQLGGNIKIETAGGTRVSVYLNESIFSGISKEKDQ